MNTVSRRDFLRLLGVGAGAAIGGSLYEPLIAKGAKNKTLRVRLYSDMQTLDPANYKASPEAAIGRAIYSKLVRYKPNSYELENDAVESITQSSDNLEVSFKLRKGIRWHKGYGELTAEDVKYSYERAANPELSAYSADFATLDRVEISDKYSGKLVFNKPFAPLWKTTLPWMVGDIISKKAHQDLGDKLWTNPIGTGPYVFEEWVPKQKVEVRKFDGFYGDEPYFDKIIFQPIQDEKTAELAFDAGEIDFTEISYSSVPRYQKEPNVKFKKLPSLAYFWLGMNVEHDLYSDVRVRKAVKWAVDTEAIVEAAYFGVPEVARTLIAPGLLGHWKNAPLYRPNLTKSRKLLKEAGYPDGFETELAILNKSEYKATAEVIKANLEKVGINVKINLMDSGTFWTITFGESGKKVELIHDRYSMGPDPSWATEWFTSEQIGKWNAMRWSNEEFDKLHHKGLVTLDDKKREQIYIRMQQLMDEDAVAEWITHGARPFVAKPNLKPAIMPHGDLQVRHFKGV